MEKIRKIIFELSEGIEIFLALVVFVLLVGSFICYIPQVKELFTQENTAEQFVTFMEEIFVYAVGIEFIKMLCKPNVDNVIEVLLFLVARHMIIGHNTAVDNLLSIISIGFLFVLKNYIKYGHISKAGYQKTEAKEEKNSAETETGKI